MPDRVTPKVGLVDGRPSNVSTRATTLGVSPLFAAAVSWFCRAATMAALRAAISARVPLGIAKAANIARS